MREFYRWDIAYRTKNDNKFKIVKPPKYGWIADPFLVEYKNEIYLFAEIFLYLSERNGVIGYSKYDGEKFGDWTVTMDKHWHLSYPNVFVENEKLYMIPESYQLGEVVLYELEEFPDKWRKKQSILIDVEYCDSTFVKYKDGLNYMFCFERNAETRQGIEYLYRLYDWNIINRIIISESLEGARCGGKIIVEDGKYIRVGQNCKETYGGGLIFYEIESMWPNYIEREIKRIGPEDVQLEKENNYCGIHTYNKLKDIEVIDLKYKCISIEEEKASERVRSVFLNKYE